MCLLALSTLNFACMRLHTAHALLTLLAMPALQALPMVFPDADNPVEFYADSAPVFGELSHRAASLRAVYPCIRPLPP